MGIKICSLSFLLVIFISFQFLVSTSERILKTPSTFSSSSLSNAEELIKSFNLKPKHRVNIIPKGSPDAPRLVENRIDFLAKAASGNSSGGPAIQEFGHYAGYYSLPHSEAAKMFYFFFESRNNNTDPVVIWLSGGPGCSSSVALFYENGPFKISEDLSLTWNDFGWDKISNIIYVDQPIGTGFSYTSNSSDLRYDEDGVSNDLYDFLQDFFKEHPKFAKNDFYITGESYAGKYIPALASRIHSANKNKEGIPINLKGFAIGNGLTNPEIQYGAYADYALDMKLITESYHESLNQTYPKCQSLAQKCNHNDGKACGAAYYACGSIYDKIIKELLFKRVNKNPYDVRKKCVGGCQDFSKMEKFLNQENVRKALGVGDIVFETCSKLVRLEMIGDWMLNIETKIPALVDDGISLLIYAGEYDFTFNWLGNSRWVDQMNWSGHKDFVSAKTVPFVVDGKKAGLMKNHGSLTFLKVHDAGHMVPMDQPNVSLQMLQKWIQGKLNTSTT